MIESYLHLRRRIVWLASTSLCWSAAAAAIWLAPKDTGFAADTRLAVAVAFGAIVVGGAGHILTQAGQLREAWLRMAYIDAPAALKITVQYLLSERLAAVRGVKLTLLAGIGFGFSGILLAWPQLAACAALRPLAGWLSAGSFVVAALLPVYSRTAWINKAFLERGLRQQRRQAGFKPHTFLSSWRQFRALRRPALRRTRRGVEAAGVVWTWEQLKKGVLVVGAPGSGKTLTIVNLMYEIPFLLFGKKFSCLVQDVKGTEAATIRRLCEKYDRTNDLYVFRLDADPENAGTAGSIILNVIDCEATALEAIEALLAAAKSLGLRTSESFFIDNLRIALTSMLEIARAGLPDDEVPNVRHLYRLITEDVPEESVTEDGEIVLTQGASSLLLELSARIAQRYTPLHPLPIGLEQAITYIQGEWKSMPQRQRAGIIGTFSQIAGDLLTEPVCHFVCGQSTITMAALLREGKLLVLHTPDAKYPRASRVVNAIFKRQFQNSVRRAVRKPIPSWYFADEYQTLFLPGADGDARFNSLARESENSTIFACQNIELLKLAAMGPHDVSAMIGTLATSIWLRNASSPETAEFASKLCGESENIIITQSEAAQLGGLFRRHRTTYSRSSGTSRVVPASTFSNLAVPVKDDPAHHYAEAIVHMGGDTRTHHRRLLFKVHLP